MLCVAFSQARSSAKPSLLRCMVRAHSTSVEPSETQLRRDLAIAHRLIAHAGQDELIWNHISARTNGKSYLVTNGTRHFSLIEPSDLVLMGSEDEDSALENVTADVIHGAIYRARPDVKAIVHTHTEAGMYVSALEGKNPLKFYTQDAGAFFGRVAWHDFEGVATDHDEQTRIIQDIGTKTPEGFLPDVLMMRQHGSTCCGSNVGEAFVKNFYLERICRVQMNVDHGRRNGMELSAEVLAKMAGQFDSPSFRHGCEWSAMVEFAERFLGCDKF